MQAVGSSSSPSPSPSPSSSSSEWFGKEKRKKQCSYQTINPLAKMHLCCCNCFGIGAVAGGGVAGWRWRLVSMGNGFNQWMDSGWERRGETRQDKERGCVSEDTWLDNTSAPDSAAGSVSNKVPLLLVSATPSQHASQRMSGTSTLLDSIPLL